jgi:hypothetical protein
MNKIVSIEFHTVNGGTNDYSHYTIEHEHTGCRQKHIKCRKIPATNAFGDPGAVMIIIPDTHIALLTVVREPRDINAALYTFSSLQKHYLMRISRSLLVSFGS